MLVVFPRPSLVSPCVQFLWYNTPLFPLSFLIIVGVTWRYTVVLLR